MNHVIEKPQEIDQSLYFKTMIDALSHVNLFTALQEDLQHASAVIRQIDSGQAAHAYAPNKWTTQQVVQHIIDCERVFAFRAMAIARGDTQNLGSFDENLYAENSMYGGVTMIDVLHEFITVRESTLSLFTNMNVEMLDAQGQANGLALTPRVIGWFAAAHSIHHIQVIEEKYL